MEDIRQAHYDAWAADKKWVEVEVVELEDKTFMARVKPEFGLGMVAYGDTKFQAISSIYRKVCAKGYEIKNLAEVQGII